MSNNPRYKNGSRRRKLRARFIAMGLPCAICGRPIHYDEPSDSKHPLSFVIDERIPVSRWREGGFNNPTHAALDPGNVQPVHWICNAQKGAKTMDELYRHNGKHRGGTVGDTTHLTMTPSEHLTMTLSDGNAGSTYKSQCTPPTINLPDGEW